MKSPNDNPIFFQHNWFKRLILSITMPSWNMRVSYFVPSDQSNFLEFEGWKFKWVFKYLKRRVYIWVFTRRDLLLESIPKDAKRILWINLSAPSLGDSLMDLSGRVLLEGIKVDLLTDPKNVELYRNDVLFDNVFSHSTEIVNENLCSSYDLFILDSFSPRVVRVMQSISSSTGFVGMWGYINGFEVHRTIYSFARIHYLLGSSLSNKKPVVPLLSLNNSNAIGFQRGSLSRVIAVVVGAEWQYRCYDKWVDVIGSCISRFEIVLVGSKNGEKDAAEITHKFQTCQNFVGKCSLIDTSQILSMVDVVIAADGGLWHVACALGKPTVGLFAATPIFDLNGNRINRDTSDMLCESVYDSIAVSNIPATEVVSALSRLLNKLN